MKHHYYSFKKLMNFSHKCAAFTLAETLITLGIIGVVAALTMPALIAKQQKKVALNQLQKAYSTFSQVLQKAQYESGTNWRDWPEWDISPEQVLKTYFLPYLDGAKVYPPSENWNEVMCFESDQSQQRDNVNAITQYVWLSGVRIASPLLANHTSSIKLKDGTCLGLNNCKPSMEFGCIFIDINGADKKPNISGKDFFTFILDNNTGLIPFANDWDYDSLTDGSKSYSCNKNLRLGGFACASKIIRDGWQMKSDYPW